MGKFGFTLRFCTANQPCTTGDKGKFSLHFRRFDVEVGRGPSFGSMSLTLSLASLENAEHGADGAKNCCNSG